VVRRAVRKAKKEYWRRFCDSVGRTTPLERIWGMIRKMKGIDRNYGYPTLIDGDKIVTMSKDKAEVIAETLDGVHHSESKSGGKERKRR